MTDTENKPVCRARYYLNSAGPWDCVLPENHKGPHRNEDGDTWGITYRDPEPVTGLGSLEISDLSRRVTALEAAWTVGGETLSERLDRIVLGITEQIRVHEHPPTDNAVTLSTDEYAGLLKDREELHALRNTAQSDMEPDTSVDDQHRANHECGPAC